MGVVVALVLGFTAVIMASGDDAELAAGAGPGGVETFDITLTEFAVDPRPSRCPPATEVIVNVTNDGAMPHDLKLNGETGTAMLDPGATSGASSLGVIDADVGLVHGARPPGGRHGDDHHGARDAPWGGGDTAAAAPRPTATSPRSTRRPTPEADWDTVRPDVRSPLPEATEHEITLHAVEAEVEVAPGVTQQAWTLWRRRRGPGEPAGGPILRGKVGDLFTVTLVNDGEIGHSIDFHASQVAWDDEMRTIEPGESCATSSAPSTPGPSCTTAAPRRRCTTSATACTARSSSTHRTWPRLTSEFVMVQSELYLGPQGEPGTLDAMVNEDFDAVVFNGYWNQYAFHPIGVEADERIRVWVVDDGPSENSAFHIVGTIFDTVWKEGTYLLQPDARRGGSQVLDLQPAQGGFVEFSFAEEGFYPMVTHKFANVGKGALGLFQAGDVELPGSGGGH